MGKKKQKKKQKKAERAAMEQAANAQPSPLHRVGQVLLDQARSPMGRQLIATGLVAAAAALARDMGRETGPKATDAEPKDTAPPPPAARPRSDTSALAGLALSALDQLLQRKAPTDKA